MGYDRLSDERLVQSIGRRDAAALAALYDRYAPRVHAVALLITREADAAATVVEAVFWECWRGGGPAANGRSVGHSLTLAARRMAERMAADPQASRNGRAD